MLNPITALRRRAPARERSASRGRPFLPALLLAACSLLCLSACLSEPERAIDEGAGPDPLTAADSLRIRDSLHVKDSIRAEPLLFALTSDHKTGSYSALGLDSDYVKRDIAPIHSDAAVRYLGGNDIFVINRLGRDNLQVVDRHNLKTVLQFAFPALSNPQDVELKDSLIYVSFLGRDKIGIYHESDGSAAGEIDVSAFADASDHLAETGALLFAGGYLYAVTENLDSETPGWDPLTAHLLKIDPVSKQVIASLELPYGNPAGIAYDSVGGKLYVPCRGFYTDAEYNVKTDGGIVGIDLGAFAVADTLATEADLGGNVNFPYLYGGKLILDVGAPAGEIITAISLEDGSAEQIATLAPYAMGGMAIDAATSTLYIGDRKTGGGKVRAFDLGSYKEKSASGISLNAPPSDLAIVR